MTKSRLTHYDSWNGSHTRHKLSPSDPDGQATANRAPNGPYPQRALANGYKLVPIRCFHIFSFLVQLGVKLKAKRYQADFGAPDGQTLTIRAPNGPYPLKALAQCYKPLPIRSITSFFFSQCNLASHLWLIKRKSVTGRVRDSGRSSHGQAGPYQWRSLVQGYKAVPIICCHIVSFLVELGL